MLWLELTWTELSKLDRERTVVILPMGAVEAHGPHLPLGTDGILAEAMARRSLAHLAEHGYQGLILPTQHYSYAGFAEGFPGTLSFDAQGVARWLGHLMAQLKEQGFRILAVANAHLDPGHLSCLEKAFESAPLRVAFPNLTRRRLAQRLTAEFQSGACHAGCFEGSMVLCERPELVRQEVAKALPDVEASLVTAIARGDRSFAEAGGPQAYFGSPRRATALEGEVSLGELARMLVESVLSVASDTLKC